MRRAAPPVLHDVVVTERDHFVATADALLDRLADEGRRLVAAHRLGSPDAMVPGLSWSARDVVAHTGAVHRWAADIVSRRLSTNETGGSQAFAWTGPEEELTDWFQAGLDHLVATLSAASADLACFTFIPGVAPREFWIRRQAHETAIHRADVEAAAGVSISGVEPWFAQDGIGELVAFASERRYAIPGPGRLLLSASDGPSWMIDFARDGNRASSGQFATEIADAAVHGTSDHLYRWAWNRPVHGLQLTGDPTVIQGWRHTIRVE